jgi:predicted GIY-YIG superfamily endonuclease
MAELFLEKGADGKWRLKVTPRRASALVEALEIALESGNLDQGIKGVVSTHLDLFASVASSEVKERDPARFVYIAQDTGAQGDGLAKIGHARDLKQRFARMTDRVTPMKLIAAWRFGSRAEAMARERSAQQAYEPCGYGGGSEWVMASVETVLADLKAKWGAPDVSND